MKLTVYTLYQHIRLVHGPRTKHFFPNFDLNLWLAIPGNGSFGPQFQDLCQVLHIAPLEKHSKEGRTRQTSLLALLLIENDNPNHFGYIQC